MIEKKNLLEGFPSSNLRMVKVAPLALQTLRSQVKVLNENTVFFHLPVGDESNFDS